MVRTRRPFNEKNIDTMKIKIRPQRVKDAKRFFEILSNQKFIYLPAKPNTIEEEKKFLRLNAEKRKKNSELNFSIFYDEFHVGGIGVRIDPFRTYIGEIGFFLTKNSGKEKLPLWH